MNLRDPMISATLGQTTIMARFNQPRRVLNNKCELNNVFDPIIEENKNLRKLNRLNQEIHLDNCACNIQKGGVTNKNGFMHLDSRT
jgi:hypothetical protein